MIEIDQLDLFRMGEHYYEQSEQRPGRFFRYDEEDIVLVTAQPECDLEWLNGLDEEKIRNIDETEELSLLEKRSYRFGCGCSQARILPVIASMSGDSIDEIFGGDEVIPAACPRCGARYIVTREILEAYLREQE
jgi:molecular chaperone Hsp33